MYNDVICAVRTSKYQVSCGCLPRELGSYFISSLFLAWYLLWLLSYPWSFQPYVFVSRFWLEQQWRALASGLWQNHVTMMAPLDNVSAPPSLHEWSIDHLPYLSSISPSQHVLSFLCTRLVRLWLDPMELSKRRSPIIITRAWSKLVCILVRTA